MRVYKTPICLLTQFRHFPLLLILSLVLIANVSSLWCVKEDCYKRWSMLSQSSVSCQDATVISVIFSVSSVHNITFVTKNIVSYTLRKNSRISCIFYLVLKKLFFKYLSLTRYRVSWYCKIVKKYVTVYEISSYSTELFYELVNLNGGLVKSYTYFENNEKSVFHSKKCIATSKTKYLSFSSVLAWRLTIVFLYIYN